MNDDNPHSSNGSAGKTWFDKIGQLFHSEPKTRNELLDLLRNATQDGLLERDNLRMLEGVLDVADLRVRDVMIPRSQIVAIEKSQSAEELFPLVIESAHSRFPVINEDKDHVEGILLAKDLLAWGFGMKDEPFTLEKVLRPAFIIPESKRLDALLNEFRSGRFHMAIVVDEYGGVSGLVTIEDILELIVGDIEDEYDREENESAPIRRLSRQDYAVEALTPIEDFNEYFGTDFADDEVDTIGGLVIHAFGHVPSRGETVNIGGYRFTIHSADERRLLQLRVRPLSDQKNIKVAAYNG